MTPDTTTLGSTELPVTRLGLGLAALGRPGYINLGHADDLDHSCDIDAMREHAHRVLDAAWQAGLRYFDAARSYGRAEEFLSSWLSARQITPDQATIGSKWGYFYTADWNRQLPDGEKHEVKDHSVSLLNQQMQESQEILHDHLDLYQIHSATLDSGVLQNDDVLNRLAELRDQGLTIGFSTSGPQQADTIRRGLEVERGGQPLFGSVQATWNLLEQRAGEALMEANRAGRGVIVKEALANGRLTERNSDPGFRTHHQPLFACARAHDVSIDAVAIACVLHQPWADVVLSGVASTDHLHSNLQAFQLVNSSELDPLLARPKDSESYWSIRSQLTWN